ncbi:MAG: DEAD/DEAH box helicase family protein [Chloroflexi bacterium]|nr:DEAD/DEAH box helicase family protein [Chloroflexota bacterium]MDA1271836.1 DEAD/DEAH box helicase family protein [Chloroflexota bacterium]PKB58286.1 MAG: type III restriction endonuclease subunit R [SAR202 cluster bacterium Casp-Chloro-G2]
MALHPDFPQSPHAILDPDIRWFPADEALRETTMDKLLPPLVPELRKQVKAWRDKSYAGATDTSRSLLNWWFNTPHLLPQSDGAMAEFQYYFAQREALETIIYLYDVVRAKDKYDLMRFDSSGAVSTGMFDETWRRLVIKMATGTGKTKVMSLALAWSYFHRLYEPDSELARNFLVIVPNIIVLDRLYRDFGGLRIFFADPVLPDNGVDGRNWRDDFQLTLHKQDQVNITRPTGNIFLTNIHRVYAGDDVPASPDDDNTMDYFLGKRPSGSTTDSKVDLGMIVRDVDELAVFNDEAHHIHDPKMAWFKSIEDIHNRLKQKGSALALEIDVTATPRHNNGAIFVQTVADYPLVEAISQNIVKHPVLPDAPSRAKLVERQSVKYTEKYADYIDLGVIEWRNAYAVHDKMGKKAILFVMTDDTQNCDDVAEYLEGNYPDLKDAVLVIHTRNNGEISEAATGKGKEELERLRGLANAIDGQDNKYKAIVSVMVLKEGWDVRNVTTIVGLRPYSAKSNILPEQTLGRGLRKMYPDSEKEEVSVVGTEAFMDFVESIQAEGVELERKPMGEGTQPKTPLVVEIDNENEKKDLNALDIEIPVLTPRVYREYKNLAGLEVGDLGNNKVNYRQFTEEQQREIIFKDITTGETTHTTVLDTAGIADYRSVIGYFSQTIMKDLRLVSGYDVLYGKVKSFVQGQLFDRPVDLEDPNTLRNMSELAATKTLIETFKKAINELTIMGKGDAEIRDTIKLRKTRPFVTKDQPYLVPSKSVFNRLVGDNNLELRFARFLEDSEVLAYAKNYFAVNFKLDYVNADGNISNYYPDFLVKVSDKKTFIVETKGREDLDVPLKMERLRQWCEDINRVQSSVVYDYVYVDEDGFEKYKPTSFKELIDNFREYR